MQTIEPTANAPYALRFVNDDYAVEYRYSLMHNLFRAYVTKREKGQVDRFVTERTTRFRTVEELRGMGLEHAENLVASL